MGKKCSVKTCKNSQNEDINDVPYHRLPQDKEARERWLTAIPKDLLRKDVTSIYICGAHFTPYSYQPPTMGLSKNMLRKNAFPTLFERCKDTKVCKTRNTTYLPSPTVSMELDISSEEEWQEEMECEMKNAATQTTSDEIVDAQRTTQKDFRDAEVQTNSRYLMLSDRERELRRRINILQKRLQRREAKISSMKDFLQYLSISKNSDRGGKETIEELIQKANASCMASTYPGGRNIIIKSLRVRGVPEESIPERLRSLTWSTIKQYNEVYKAWWAFCKRKHLPLFTPKISDVIKFLQEQFSSENSRHGTFDCYISALALIIQYDIESNPQLRSFITQMTTTSPPERHTWNLQPVLDYLETFYPNEDLPLDKLSKKLITLLALVTEHKFDTFRSINLENVIISEEGVQIPMPSKSKTMSIESQHLPYFNEKPEICVALTLLQYIEATAPLRTAGQEHLFLTTRPPHCVASTHTLNSWVHDTLKESGINMELFTTYSMKHTSESDAFKNGISLDLLRKNADWSNQSNTFATFYKCPENV